jgi:ABC-2 type transport system permease protein
MLRGYLYHLQLTLRLNFASKQALVYGYLVPVFFLVAFGTVFRTGIPPLLHEMSQLITISALGGACFGMPTALVAERERGLWRRFRLLPRATVPLVASTLTARFMLIASAAALQIGLARLIYGTPFPQHPALFGAAYCFAAFAFLGLGLLLAALANDVPAVQALGQCVFLPLIMIGGVGVPLAVLPVWAQKFAGFFPGRYSVDALRAGYSGEGGGLSLTYNLAALLAIGAAAGLAGAMLFRWDPGHRTSRRSWIWIVVALLPWIAVGAGALGSGRWRAVAVPTDPAMALTEAQINSIDFSGLPPDDSVVTPLAPSIDRVDPEQRVRLDDLAARLKTWAPGRVPDSTQAIRNLLCVAAFADLYQDPLEGSIARVVVDHLFANFQEQQLTRGLAWIALHPDEGTVPTDFSELGFPGGIDAGIVRERSLLYAKKVLGRIRGRLTN